MIHLADNYSNTMGVKNITRLQNIFGELISGIPGNDYHFHYLPKILGELIFGPFG